MPLKISPNHSTVNDGYNQLHQWVGEQKLMQLSPPIQTKTIGGTPINNKTMLSSPSPEIITLQPFHLHLSSNKTKSSPLLQL